MLSLKQLDVQTWNARVALDDLGVLGIARRMGVRSPPNRMLEMESQQGPRLEKARPMCSKNTD